jgi:hypothetical protein
MPGRRSRKTTFRALFLTLVLLCLVASAQQTPRKLTNDDIIKMTRDGFTEGVIVALIDGSYTAFDVSISGLTALKEAGVSSKVMEAMLKAETKKRQAAEASAPDGRPTWPRRRRVLSRPFRGAAIVSSRQSMIVGRVRDPWPFCRWRILSSSKAAMGAPSRGWKMLCSSPDSCRFTSPCSEVVMRVREDGKMRCG